MENIGSFAGENTSCNFLSESTAGIKSTATQIWQLQAIVPPKNRVPHGILVSFFKEYRYAY